MVIALIQCPLSPILAVERDGRAGVQGAYKVRPDAHILADRSSLDAIDQNRIGGKAGPQDE
jgi:hypothetical protein